MLDIVDRKTAGHQAHSLGVIPLYGIVPENWGPLKNACFAASPM
jgi:hypothetical protein